MRTGYWLKFTGSSKCHIYSDNIKGFTDTCEVVYKFFSPLNYNQCGIFSEHCVDVLVLECVMKRAEIYWYFHQIDSDCTKWSNFQIVCLQYAGIIYYHRIYY